MSNFKREFIQDFLAGYPDKEVLKDFINKLPLADFDKKYLIMKYCKEKVTPHKVMAFNLADWYYVLNMTYSDKYKQGKTSEDYIDDAYMFLDDVDAPHDKAKRYYLAMCD